MHLASLYGFLLAIRSGYEGEYAALSQAQDAALAAKSPQVVRALTRKPKGPVAFTHVRAFLDGGRFADDQTIVVDKGVITAVGNILLGPLGAVVIGKKRN